MLKDHLRVATHDDIKRGVKKIRADYHITCDEECDIADDELAVAGFEEDVVHKINQTLIDDIFCNSDLTNEDVAYILDLGTSHAKVERQREIMKLTKNLSVSDVRHLVTAYGALYNLGMFGGAEMKYRKKPVVIDAYQTDVELDIPTLEGIMHASVGDYIITGVHGEQYPCKPDIFEETYEPAEETK